MEKNRKAFELAYAAIPAITSTKETAWLIWKAALSAAPAQEPADEHPAEEALRSLACWLGVGGYNAPTVDAKLYEQKIREGVTVYSQLHGFAARDLAETVLHMDLITPKGIRARELARQVLGIVPPFASPLPQEPQEGKALQKAYEAGWVQCATWAERDDLITDCDSGAYARERDAALAKLRVAQEVKAGEWLPIESAPKDGTEILAWREDCGPFMAKWSCVNDLRTTTDKDRDEMDEETLFSFDWFGGDSECTFRADGSEAPTHWMPLPADPSATLAASREGEQR